MTQPQYPSYSKSFGAEVEDLVRQGLWGVVCWMASARLLGREGECRVNAK